jgi:cysteine desulfurase/selenocysteine lyase
MSTSEQTLAGTVAPNSPSETQGLPGTPGQAPGVLSPAELARMANEMFRALPEELQQPLVAAARVGLPPNSALSGNPYAAIPSPTAPAVPGILASNFVEALPLNPVPWSDNREARDRRYPVATPSAPRGGPGVGAAPHPESVFGFLADARSLYAEPDRTEPSSILTPSHAFAGEEPGEAGFAAIPFSLLSDIPPSQLSEATQPPAPAIPSAFGVVDSSAVPAFSFLEDARPLFSTSPTIPGPVPADAKGAGAERGSKTAAGANPFAYPLDLNAPQFPGAIAHAPGSRVPASVDTSSQPRLLYPVDPAPLGTPDAGQPELLGDLGLSSYSFDVEAIRRDFPILREVVNGHPLIWLDNGATTQKPQSVIDRLKYFYEHENSNVHRAAHELAARSTDAYESAREKTHRFLNAGSSREIVFVRGATEAINLVAQSWGRRNVEKDDEIVITWLEHHANIVPWQMLCAEKGARLRVAPVDDSGQVLLDEYEKLLGPKTRLVSIAHVSNALGTVVPVKEMVEAAHRHGARVLVDGAQAVSHMRVDVQAINCDFYVFSGHKVFAPTGIGVVYAKPEVLDNMPPWQGGGNMIQDVTFEKTLYQPPPQRFEAGTGNIADAVGLGAAIDYLDRVGIANVARHEHMLLTYATAALERIPGLHIIGTAKEKAGVLSFVMDGFRTEEIGDYLNRKGIAVRGGHHCAQPILRRFGVESTLRATLALYNTCEEIDALVAALWDLRQGRNPGIA